MERFTIIPDLLACLANRLQQDGGPVVAIATRVRFPISLLVVDSGDWLLLHLTDRGRRLWEGGLDGWDVCPGPLHGEVLENEGKMDTITFQ